MCYPMRICTAYHLHLSHPKDDWDTSSAVDSLCLVLVSCAEQLAKLERVGFAQSQWMRQQFTMHFLNRSHPEYHSAIEELRPFSDGPAYVGYMWDFTAERNVIDPSAARTWLRSVRVAGVLFDLHSREMVREDVDIRLREVVFVGAGATIIDSYDQWCLPRDAYVFSTDWSWYLALTHEDIIDGTQYVLASNLVWSEVGGSRA